MRDTILPLYANTHSMQSASGKQTVFAREEARSSLKSYFNANENDALIFTGSGATYAINLFVNRLKIKSICADIELKKKLVDFPNEKVENFLNSGAEINKNYCK